MSRAMEEMERLADKLSDSQRHRLIEWIDEELIPFLEDRSDTDGGPEGYSPNEEMKLLSDLEAILGRSGRPW